MRVTLFTSNQPRHTSLINRLDEVCDLTAVVETTTSLASGYHKSYTSDVKAEYFQRVADAEKTVFGKDRLIECPSYPLVMGDVNQMIPDAPEPEDRYIVFGASYIQSPLCDFLIEKKAINIHMGIAPQYRGSSCNFWAMYDHKRALVGATVHLLSKGLDSGAILWLSKSTGDLRDALIDPFKFTMQAVKIAHDGILDWVGAGAGLVKGYPQDKSKEIRYTKASDFTDEICAKYLERLKKVGH
jgi:hypothetical protein